MRYTQQTLRTINFKGLTILKVDKDMEQWVLSHPDGENANWYKTLKNYLALCAKVEYIHIL